MNTHLKTIISTIMLYGKEYVITNSKEVISQSSAFDKIKENVLLIEDNIYKYKNKFYEYDNKIITLDNVEYKIETYNDITRFQNLIMELKEDKITTLPNRNEIENFIERHKEYHNDMIFVLCDIDDFKQINDTYGHQMGDYILNKVGIIFKENVRGKDFVGRYGGEEFLLIFKTNDLHIVEKRLEKIRLSILKDEKDKVDEEIKVYFSAGIARYKENDNIKDIINRADMASYYVKEHGKNGDAIYDDKTKTCEIIRMI
ncbi:MAG: GGDEF domain-containing protein [Bacilli bacterium]